MTHFLSCQPLPINPFPSHPEHKCHGWFLPHIAVATLNFRTPERSTTVTYRVVDEDTMAVSIVEVESQRSVLQYGHMLRLPVMDSGLSGSGGWGGSGGGMGGGGDI